MSISAADMRDQLLTVDEVLERLAPTEGLATVDLPAPDEGHAEFVLPDGFNAGLKDAPSVQVTDALIRVGGVEHRLAKDALLAMTTAAGITREYVCRIPAELLVPHLNYWWTRGTFAFKLLTNADGDAIAAVKENINPFSNVRLVEQTVEAIRQKLGNVEVLADYKFQHDLRATRIRLVVPDNIRTITSARHSQDNEDVWSTGIEIRNSIIGEKPLSLRGYQFAWFCTNGATSSHASSGNYNRRTQGQGEEVYEWARGQVDSILGGLEHELDAVQSLVNVELQGNIPEVTQSVFERYRVPLASREEIINHLVNSDDLTAYGLMAAVTEAANKDSLHFGQVDSLLDIGGDLPHAMGDRCESCNRL